LDQPYSCKERFTTTVYSRRPFTREERMHFEVDVAQDIHQDRLFALSQYLTSYEEANRL
jgi:hypothetical protein